LTFDILGLIYSTVAHQNGCLAVRTFPPDTKLSTEKSSLPGFDWLTAAPVRLWGGSDSSMLRVWHSLQWAALDSEWRLKEADFHGSSMKTFSGHE
jgi:hypothetical protein